MAGTRESAATLLAQGFCLTRLEAAQRLGASERTVDRYIAAGRLGTRRYGRTVLVSHEDVDALAAEIGRRWTQPLLPFAR